MTDRTDGLKVLVTGAAGAVGRAVCTELARRGHVVRGFDRAAEPAGWGGQQWHRGELADQEAVRRAVADMDAVVHLAANPSGGAAFLEQLLEPNVVGLFHVMDAAREAGVGRVVLASSVQVISGVKANVGELGRPLRADDGAAPRNHYALTKLWAEQMGEMYARVHDMSVIAVRIGWLPRDPEGAAVIARRGGEEMYLSWDDAGRFFACAVEAEGVAYSVLFAFSLGDGSQRYDREAPRQVIGYEPRDRFPEGLPFALPAEAEESQPG